MMDLEDKKSSVIFPKHFNFLGKEITVLDGETKALEVGAYDITPDYVLYTAYLPVMQVSHAKRHSGKDASDDLNADADAFEETEYPFVLLKQQFVPKLR